MPQDLYLQYDRPQKTELSLPPTSTEVLTQMSAIFHHTNQIQTLKMFSKASSAVFSPFYSFGKTFPHHYVAMLKFHMTTQFQAQHWQKSHTNLSIQHSRDNTYGWNSAHWIHLVQTGVLWMQIETSGSTKYGHFSTSWETAGFSRSGLFHMLGWLVGSFGSYLACQSVICVVNQLCKQVGDPSGRMV